MRIILNFVVLAAVGLLEGGCASIQSTPLPSGNQDGLTYFLPRKDVVVTVTVTDQNKLQPDVVFEEGAAYPDLASPYVLDIGLNLLASADGDIAISASGLLKSSKSVVTSNLAEALKSLADAVAATGTSPKILVVPDAESPPCAPGTYKYVWDLAHEIHVCGDIFVRAGRAGAVPRLEPSARAALTGQAQPGIFYRQSEPFIVSANHGSAPYLQKLVFSPNGSPAKFLPVTRTFFANNNSTMAFDADGLLTGYHEIRDGELVAALKLPAAVIEAYFAAVGRLLDAFKNNADKETALLDQKLALDRARQKFEDCRAARAANQAELLTQLGC